MDIDIYLSILFHLSISFDSEKQRMIQRDRKNNQISKILLLNIYICIQLRIKNIVNIFIIIIFL